MTELTWNDGLFGNRIAYRNGYQITLTPATKMYLVAPMSELNAFRVAETLEDALNLTA